MGDIKMSAIGDEVADSSHFEDDEQEEEEEEEKKPEPEPEPEKKRVPRKKLSKEEKMAKMKAMAKKREEATKARARPAHALPALRVSICLASCDAPPHTGASSFRLLYTHSCSSSSSTRAQLLR